MFWRSMFQTLFKYFSLYSASPFNHFLNHFRRVQWMNSNGRLLPDSTVPPTSRIATKEARQKQDCCPKLPTSRIAARSPPQAELRPRRLTTSRVAARSPQQAELRPRRLTTSRIAAWSSPQAELLPGAPNKQNYDQGCSPQAELRPRRLPTSSIAFNQVPRLSPYTLHLNPMIVHAQGPGMHGTLTSPSKGYTIRPTDAMQWPDSPAK